MTHYLPYPTARRLHDAGLKLEADYAWASLPGTEPQLVINGELERYRLQAIPAPTFDELWDELPDEIMVDGIGCIKCMMPDYIGYRYKIAGFAGEYYIRFFSPAERVEAAALLVLMLHEKAMVLTPDTNGRKSLG